MADELAVQNVHRPSAQHSPSYPNSNIRVAFTARVVAYTAANRTDAYTGENLYTLFFYAYLW